MDTCHDKYVASLNRLHVTMQQSDCVYWDPPQRVGMKRNKAWLSKAVAASVAHRRSLKTIIGVKDSDICQVNVLTLYSLGTVKKGVLDAIAQALEKLPGMTLVFPCNSKEIEATKQELAKLRTEIRYELDKLIAGQRLDLNLEKGRLRDELQATTQSVQTIETQLHKDLNTIRTKIEENKNELIKYSIGLLVAAGSIALGMLRFLAV